jgi:hypothetical protein
VRIRVSNLPGDLSWEGIGDGAAIAVHHGVEGGAIVPLPRASDLKPPPKPVVFDGEPLARATELQRECLDAVIASHSQADAARKLKMPERQFRRILTPLRESSGLSVIQLALVRDRERRDAA